MDGNTPSPEERLAELVRKRASVELRLAQLRSAQGDLPEEALMLVPQSLLPLVKGGSTEDFKAVAQHMASDFEDSLSGFSRMVQDFEATLVRSK